MEALLELVIMAIVNVAMIIFDPIILACKYGKRFYDSINPDNLPEVLTFDEDD